MPRFEPLDWYANALYYDIIFDVDTPREAAFLERVHAKHVTSRGRRVLEPACGSGRLVTALARRGFAVTGFDMADGMLDFARRRLREQDLNARLVNARMESFDLKGPFDLAHCFVSTFKYLLEEADARAHLERVAAALAPGGVYVLGLHLTDYTDRAEGRERWVARRGADEVVCTIAGWPADRRTRQERVRSRLVVTNGAGVRRYETEWQFRTYGPRQLRSLLKQVPALEHIATYDFDYDIDRPQRFGGDRLDTVLILRKKR